MLRPRGSLRSTTCDRFGARAFPSRVGVKGVCWFPRVPSSTYPLGHEEARRWIAIVAILFQGTRFRWRSISRCRCAVRSSSCDGRSWPTSESRFLTGWARFRGATWPGCSSSWSRPYCYFTPYRASFRSRCPDKTIKTG
jgi:hypothetical protein